MAEIKSLIPYDPNMLISESGVAPKVEIPYKPTPDQVIDWQLQRTRFTGDPAILIEVGSEDPTDQLNEVRAKLQEEYGLWVDPSEFAQDRGYEGKKTVLHPNHKFNSLEIDHIEVRDIKSEQLVFGEIKARRGDERVVLDPGLDGIEKYDSRGRLRKNPDDSDGPTVKRIFENIEDLVAKEIEEMSAFDPKEYVSFFKLGQEDASDVPVYVAAFEKAMRDRGGKITEVHGTVPDSNGRPSSRTLKLITSIIKSQAGYISFIAREFTDPNEEVSFDIRIFKTSNVWQLSRETTPKLLNGKNIIENTEVYKADPKERLGGFIKFSRN